MSAICDAGDFDNDTALQANMKEFPERYPLARPLALAEAMTRAAERIRALTLGGDQTLRRDVVRWLPIQVLAEVGNGRSKVG